MQYNNNNGTNVQWNSLFRALKIANAEQTKARKSLRNGGASFTPAEVELLKKFNFASWHKSNEQAILNNCDEKTVLYLKSLLPATK